jgi:hypothetical protein
MPTFLKAAEEGTAEKWTIVHCFGGLSQSFYLKVNPIRHVAQLVLGNSP